MNPARIIGHTGPILGACNKAVALGVELLCAKGKGNKRLVGWGGVILQIMVISYGLR